jgi:hypothetical protein
MFFQKPISFYQTIRHHIPEDGILRGQRCVSLASQLRPRYILHVKEYHMSEHNDLPIDMKSVLRTAPCYLCL